MLLRPLQQAASTRALIRGVPGAHAGQQRPSGALPSPPPSPRPPPEPAAGASPWQSLGGGLKGPSLLRPSLSEGALSSCTVEAEQPLHMTDLQAAALADLDGFIEEGDEEEVEEGWAG